MGRLLSDTLTLATDQSREISTSLAIASRRRGSLSNCHCGLSKPPASIWWPIIFTDGAVLSISAEQFFLAGKCPIAALNQLVQEFGVHVDGYGICAPFAFGDPDRARTCQFLHSIMRLTIADYDRRPSPLVGLC